MTREIFSGEERHDRKRGIADRAARGVTFGYAGWAWFSRFRGTTGRRAMGYLLVRHKVKDFHEWKRVFDMHKSAQREAGLRIEKVLRNLYEPNEVFLFFEVTDLGKARGFVFSPGVPDAQAESDVVDKPDIYFLA
jgi:hypothetical protein